MSSFVFVCGCLEIGKDGVGDYSRRLGSELLRQGHQVSIIAINDKYIEDNLEEYQQDAETKIETLRLSSNIEVTARFLYAKKWINQKRPEWVSLQFVPYSFHKKGLPFHLPSKFRFLTVDTKVHIMFHEPMVWIGYTKTSSIKDALIGKLQKVIIKRLVKKCQPDIINTSNQLYQLLLARISVRASILPLFSNIGVKINDEPLQPDVLPVLQISNRDNYWVFVFFGRIRGEFNENYLFENIISIAANSGKTIAFIFLGELGKNGDEKYNLWQKRYPEIHFIKTGFQNDESISWYLSISDFAVTNVPPELADRSGTIAAFKEHGLPIIFTREELNWKFEVNINYNFSYILMRDISRFNTYKKSNKNCNQLHSVAHSFINQISQIQL